MMVRKIAHLMMLALAAGAFLWAGSVRANPAVPLKLHGQLTIVANLQDIYVDANGNLILPAVVHETGEGTDLGRYSNTAHALHNVITDVTLGEGQFTAANGDTLNYTFFQPPNSPTTLRFSGGTGRFADATGSATSYGSNVTQTLQGNLLMFSEDETTVGTISS